MPLPHCLFMTLEMGLSRDLVLCSVQRYMDHWLGGPPLPWGVAENLNPKGTKSWKVITPGMLPDLCGCKLGPSSCLGLFPA